MKTLLGHASATRYSDKTGSRKTVYHYWVKAISNAQGTSGFSSSDTGYRLIRPLPTRNVVASNGLHDDKIVLTWSRATGATSYRIYRSTDNNSSNAVEIDHTTGTSYMDTMATPGTTYYYWVKADDGQSLSLFSDAAIGKQAERPPILPDLLLGKSAARQIGDDIYSANGILQQIRLITKKRTVQKLLPQPRKRWHAERPAFSERLPRQSIFQGPLPKHRKRKRHLASP